MQRDGKRHLAPKVGQKLAFIAREVVVNGLSHPSRQLFICSKRWREKKSESLV